MPISHLVERKCSKCGKRYPVMVGDDLSPMDFRREGLCGECQKKILKEKWGKWKDKFK